MPMKIKHKNKCRQAYIVPFSMPLSLKMQRPEQIRALFTAPVSVCVFSVSLSRRVMASGKVGVGRGYDVTLLRLAVSPVAERFQTPRHRNESRVFWRDCYDRFTTLVSGVFGGEREHVVVS